MNKKQTRLLIHKVKSSSMPSVEGILSRKLTNFEKQVYDFIKGRDVMLVSNVVKNVSGAFPNLKNEVPPKTFEKPTTNGASKKDIFVKVI